MYSEWAGGKHFFFRDDNSTTLHIHFLVLQAHQVVVLKDIELQTQTEKGSPANVKSRRSLGCTLLRPRRPLLSLASTPIQVPPIVKFPTLPLLSSLPLSLLLSRF